MEKMMNQIVDIMRHVDTKDVQSEIAAVLGQKELFKKQEIIYLTACARINLLTENKEMNMDDYIEECDKIAADMAADMLMQNKTAYYLDNGSWNYLLIVPQEGTLMFMDDESFEVIKNDHKGETEKEVARYIMENVNVFDFEWYERSELDNFLEDQLIFSVKEAE